MNGKVMEFKKRYTEITNKLEILDLEKEIKEFLESETGKKLPEKEMDSIDELLMNVLIKKEYFHSGLDPRRFKH